MRRLLRLLTLLSALLCAATSLLWASGKSSPISISLDQPLFVEPATAHFPATLWLRYRAVTFDSGFVEIVNEDVRVTGPAASRPATRVWLGRGRASAGEWTFGDLRDSGGRYFLGIIGWLSSAEPRATVLVIPCWLVCLLTLLGPVWHVMARRRHRGIRQPTSASKL